MTYQANDQASRRAKIPFDGRVRRSNSERYDGEDGILIERVDAGPGKQRVRVRHVAKSGVKELEPVIERSLAALIVPAQPGRERTEIYFEHPADPRRLVGIVLDDGRGEIDGVWVAEEGGDIDPDG